MNSIKANDSFNKTNKVFGSITLKFDKHEKNSFDNIMVDINLDIMHLNKKLDNQVDYQKHIQSLMEEEIKLRQGIEKKAFLINENLSVEISKMKQNFILFSNDIQENLKNNLKKNLMTTK